MANTIDDIIEEKVQTKPQSVEELLKDDKPIHAPEWYDKPRSILGRFWDIAKYGAMMGGMFLTLGAVGLPALTITASTYISAFGLTVGSLYDNSKKKIKNTWRRCYKEFGFGNLVGLVDYAVFSMPGMLLNAFPGFFGAGTFFTNIIKTLIFNPLTIPPLLFVYNSMKYVRDYVGLNPIKFVSKSRNMYRRATFTMKQEIKDTFLYLFPLHYIQFNYLPSAPIRMAQSAVINNPIFRYITAKKEGKTQIENKPNNVIDYKPSEYQKNATQQYKIPE